MKDEEQARSFSFHLSASAPPAEVDDRAPDSGPSWFSPETDRLDLDLDAFAPSAPAPEVASQLGVEEQALAPQPIAAAEPDLATASAAVPPETVAGAAHSAPPRISADDITRTPAPVDATSPPPPTTGAARVAAGPAVRHVRFPSAATTSRASAARRSETVFSTSLSQAPRARLESSDDNELEGGDAREALPPEDLPLSAQRPARSSGPQQHGADKAARAAVSALSELARQGALLGRRGTEQGARLAKDASARARELWSSGRQRALAKLAEGRATRDSSSVAAVPTVAPCEDAALVPGSDDLREQQFSERAAPSRGRSLSSLRGPWLSGGAALLAAGVCYVGASRLVAAHGPGAPSATSEATAEQTTAEARDEAQEHAARDDDAEDGAALPPLPALAKSIPVAPGAQEATDEDAEAAPISAPADKTSRKQPATPAAVETLALPEGMSWPDKGLIEVVTEGRELVYVDGVFTGRGPLRRIPIQPGSHEVVVRTEGQERKMRLDVSTGRRARVVFGS